jgi:putative ATP-dependent endonuclease of OLD family
VVRAGQDGTTIKSLLREFRCRVPNLPAFAPVIAASGGLLEYDGGLSELVIKGSLPTGTYRNLLAACNGHADMAALHARLRAARDASLEYIPDDDLQKLETFARRIRGEIFFANKWLLVEGQSEYHLVHGMAKAMNFDLDEHGVAVIDFANNGNCGMFAALARALGFPWTMVVDGDLAGNQYIDSVLARNFTPAEVAQLTRQIAGRTLEHQLVADGLQPELKAILIAQGVPGVAAMDDASLIATLSGDKCVYAAELAEQCAASLRLTQRMPLAIREAIETLRGLP